MKQREICQQGKINNAGRLEMFMGEINAFFQQWKGASVIVRFSVAASGTSEALKGYYFNYIVPTFRQAYWDGGDRMTEEQTELNLRKISPVMYREKPDPVTGTYNSELKEISELSNSELIEHIELLKQLGAEEMNIYIADPNEL